MIPLQNETLHDFYFWLKQTTKERDTQPLAVLPWPCPRTAASRFQQMPPIIRTAYASAASNALFWTTLCRFFFKLKYEYHFKCIVLRLSGRFSRYNGLSWSMLDSHGVPLNWVSLCPPHYLATLLSQVGVTFISSCCQNADPSCICHPPILAQPHVKYSIINRPVCMQKTKSWRANLPSMTSLLT